MAKHFLQCFVHCNLSHNSGLGFMKVPAKNLTYGSTSDKPTPCGMFKASGVSLGRMVKTILEQWMWRKRQKP
jgi:hypothetical protein